MRISIKYLLTLFVLILLQLDWCEPHKLRYLHLIKKGAAAAAGLATIGLGGGKKIVPIPIPIPFELFPPPVIGPPLPPPFLPPHPVVIGLGHGYGRLVGGGPGHGFVGRGFGGGGWGGGHGGGFGGGFGGYG